MYRARGCRETHPQGIPLYHYRGTESCCGRCLDMDDATANADESGSEESPHFVMQVVSIAGSFQGGSRSRAALRVPPCRPVPLGHRFHGDLRHRWDDRRAAGSAARRLRVAQQPEPVPTCTVRRPRGRTRGRTNLVPQENRVGLWGSPLRNQGRSCGVIIVTWQPAGSLVASGTLHAPIVLQRAECGSRVPGPVRTRTQLTAES
ncbi:MAG: hypothetical protein JWO04_1946 [Gammaproteobacteria bacterium]|nr:hypothetical protein [Gammaproteobacteria bacterium]